MMKKSTEKEEEMDVVSSLAYEL
jgi:hypothetical protein